MQGLKDHYVRFISNKAAQWLSIPENGFESMKQNITGSTMKSVCRTIDKNVAQSDGLPLSIPYIKRKKFQCKKFWWKMFR